MTAVSLVVVAYHRPQSLARLLGGLRGDDGLEVIVANVDDDPEVAEVAATAGARVVGVPGNPGFAAGVNRGVEIASGDVIVYGNDDLVIEREDLARLTAAVASGQCDVAVPRILDADGQVERTIAALPTPTTLLLEWTLLPDEPIGALRVLPVQKWRLPAVAERVRSATGALVAVRADLARDHPLPEEYFLYWEEQEWFWRLRAADADVRYLPDAVACHQGGRADVRPGKSVLMARNAVRCVRRTQGRWRAALAIPVVVLWNLRLLAVDVVRRAAGRPGGERVGARWAGVRAALGSWRELR